MRSNKASGGDVLYHTGHALVDVGIDVLTVFSELDRAEYVTASDLEAAANFLEHAYTAPGPMRAFARGAVFHNAGYTSSPDPARQRAYADRVLRSWRSGSPVIDSTCAFCGRPAAYRATRQEVPLLNGLGIYNFSPGAQAGIPICGLCSLAVQALPLGCVKSEGGLLTAYSDDPTITFDLVKACVQHTLKFLSLQEPSLPGYPFPRTRLIEMVVSWSAAVERHDAASASLTGYFFTNAGAAPAITIYPLASDVVDFLERVLHHADATLTAAWHRAVARAWEQPKKGSTDLTMQRNRLYEAVLDFPSRTRQVLRRYLYPTGHWGLVALFLVKVMHMDPERIALLRTLGDRFAQYVKGKKAFFYQFSRTDEYARWRRLVLRAADDHIRATATSLITFDEFVQAFTAPPGEINDWRLARDLVTLALIDARAAGSAGQADEEPLFEDIEEENS